MFVKQQHMRVDNFHQDSERGILQIEQSSCWVKYSRTLSSLFEQDINLSCPQLTSILFVNCPKQSAFEFNQTLCNRPSYFTNSHEKLRTLIRKSFLLPKKSANNESYLHWNCSNGKDFLTSAAMTFVNTPRLYSKIAVQQRIKNTVSIHCDHIRSDGQMWTNICLYLFYLASWKVFCSRHMVLSFWKILVLTE